MRVMIDCDRVDYESSELRITVRDFDGRTFTNVRRVHDSIAGNEAWFMKVVEECGEALLRHVRREKEVKCKFLPDMSE